MGINSIEALLITAGMSEKNLTIESIPRQNPYESSQRKNSCYDYRRIR